MFPAFYPCQLIPYMSSNRSAVRECKVLGACLKTFNNKACRPVHTTVVYIIYIFTVTGTMWTFLYKEVPICACVGRQPNGREYIARILPFLDNLLMFYQAFGVSLSLAVYEVPCFC